MSISADISLTDIISNTPKKIIRHKGNNLLIFPDEYVVVDIETTGFSPEYDDIIEIALIKISNGNIVDKFSTLIKPISTFLDDDYNEYYIDDFISELTGITNDMLMDAPEFSEVANQMLSFVSKNIVVGHNVNFDINFLYDNLMKYTGSELNNDYCDLLRISRKLFPDLENHKLKTLAKEFNIEQPEVHRGLADCKTTFLCFEYCKSYANKNNINLTNLHKTNSDLRKITTNKIEFDKHHPFFDKYCVFTGTLERMKRRDAAQLVVDIGGYCENNVTKKTNYLILGNNDYCKSIKKGKSNKQKKAESLILKGQDLSIIPEDVFYDMVLDHIEQ